ncbi:predicted protein [Nematostella vectensis]|uniref:Uncharacterized protein n=1 Tax=Nematostella vectensis TaxID=45351 RepID=A7SB38_NEMVE|nr:predicted protein [Nematostella vectensis]|eukprot:XP_001631157.1 predicted protein [Nematostella vectensis]
MLIDFFPFSCIKQYFQSLKDDINKKYDGTLDAYRKSCRQYQTVIIKQQKVLNAVETINWPEEKERFADVLNDVHNISSEKSEEEGDGVVFFVKSLKRAKNELRILKELESHH